uniref:Uncharacterized protein n=1 Tax=Romanomermis culicivorax TaxID=13658 RepID=A0A915L8A7_ROMCU
MEVIPEVNKAKGDTIEEGLEKAIDAAGSSICQKEEYCKQWSIRPVCQKCAIKHSILTMHQHR